MSKTYVDALATARSANKSLRNAVWIVAGIGLAGMYFAARVPKQLDVHLSPNIQGGETLSVLSGESDVPAVNVYGFAYYIWQQINRWQNDGYADYGKQIYYFQSYITPACRSQLESDMQARSRSGELTSRTRLVTEIPAFGFSAQRVLQEGTGAWNVLLDLQLQEAFKGQSIKDIFIRYPIRVVRYDVDREKNPWRLAIDCFGNNRPERLSSADVIAVQKGQRAIELPSQIAPVTLPTVGNHPGVSVSTRSLEVQSAPQPQTAPIAPIAPTNAAAKDVTP